MPETLADKMSAAPEPSPADKAEDTITKMAVDELLADKKKQAEEITKLQEELASAKDLIKQILHGQQEEPQGPPPEEEEDPDDYIKRVYWDREQYQKRY